MSQLLIICTFSSAYAIADSSAIDLLTKYYRSQLRGAGGGLAVARQSTRVAHLESDSHASVHRDIIRMFAAIASGCDALLSLDIVLLLVIAEPERAGDRRWFVSQVGSAVPVATHYGSISNISAEFLSVLGGRLDVRYSRTAG